MFWASVSKTICNYSLIDTSLSCKHFLLRVSVGLVFCMLLCFFSLFPSMDAILYSKENLYS